MPQQDITIQYLGLNKKNPKYAYIKSAEGDSYGCSPEQLKQFSTGEVCNISYQINQKGFKDFLAKNNTKGAPQGISKTNARPRMDPADARGAFITVILEAFVKAGKGTQANPPAPGSGAGLAPGSGWNAQWNVMLPKDSAARQHGDC